MAYRGVALYGWFWGTVIVASRSIIRVCVRFGFLYRVFGVSLASLVSVGSGSCEAFHSMGTRFSIAHTSHW